MEEQERSIRSLIVRYLIAHTQCSGCGRRYTAPDVRIHNNHGDVWLASVTCHHCGMQGFVMAAIATDDSKAADRSEAQPAEVQDVALAGLGPILGDEILDLHCFLQEFDGSMVELLSEVDLP